MKILKVAVSLFIVAGALAATSARDAVPPEASANPIAAGGDNHVLSNRLPGITPPGGSTRPAPYDGAMKDILVELRNNPEFVAKVEAAKVRLAADPDYRARVEARWPRGKARPN
jgi:hypothetical protein